MFSGGRKLVCGSAVLVALFALGAVAKTATLTRWDTAFDEELAERRTSGLTWLAKAATEVSQTSVGVALALLLPLVLWMSHRRRDAVRVLLVFVGALTVTLVAKVTVAEHRPPARLWVEVPDNAQSFPSGHTTIAAALALALVLVVRGRARVPAAVLGLLLTAGVALARMYLGVHHPPDVAGGVLSARAALLLTLGFLELPPVARRLPRGDRSDDEPRKVAAASL
ncbi:phosphatase PAP2 family protein [Streptomyces sp. Vc74B-19]|uniref:phosphatase PAP2 family protein n=1 Tax=Streptomyces sp. Vc74B-19 TaxID=2741324 RepID=UPI001BFC6C3B|nr:phosphatase PAP2 family protein [Streptomyces sp. Vc74B-19]MBT3162703.1 phosphatase PAP2 family protein [Streptomyces sp. Vc74B-19]